MPRARGLGRRFDDITRDLEEFYGEPASGQELPTRDKPYGATGRRSLFPGGTDFGPYFLDEADSYYQGPGRSTRVKAHQFVPDDPGLIDRINQGIESGTLSQSQFADFNIMGRIYVRFLKRNSLWVYGTAVLIPLAEYRSFRNSVSKGKSVRYLEQYGHRAASQDPGVEI